MKIELRLKYSYFDSINYNMPHLPKKGEKIYHKNHSYKVFMVIYDMDNTNIILHIK